MLFRSPACPHLRLQTGRLGEAEGTGPPGGGAEGAGGDSYEVDEVRRGGQRAEGWSEREGGRQAEGGDPEAAVAEFKAEGSSSLRDESIARIMWCSCVLQAGRLFVFAVPGP